MVEYAGGIHELPRLNIVGPSEVNPLLVGSVGEPELNSELQNCKSKKCPQHIVVRRYRAMVAHVEIEVRVENGKRPKSNLVGFVEVPVVVIDRIGGFH